VSILAPLKGGHRHGDNRVTSLAEILPYLLDQGFGRRDLAAALSHQVGDIYLQLLS
jgi:hypothetical protein